MIGLAKVAVLFSDGLPSLPSGYEFISSPINDEIGQFLFSPISDEQNQYLYGAQ